MTRSHISSGQLAALLFASRLSYGLLLPTDAVMGLSLTDRLLAAVLGSGLLLALFLPTLIVLRASSCSLVDYGYRYSRGCGRAVAVGYAVVCLFILCVDSIQFCDFADRVMPSGFSVAALAVSLIAVAFAASSYGVQTLARAALPVAAFSVICLLVFGAALLPEIRLLHFPPIASVGVGGIVSTAVRNLPRTAEVVLLGVLYPYVRGSRMRAALMFSGGVTMLTSLVVFTAVGVLGDFALQTAYPYYTAVTAAQIGVFERLDILITAVWLGTFFMRVTLFCRVFTDMVGRVSGARRWAAVFGAVALSLFTIAVSRGRVSGQGLDVVYGAVLVAVCVVLPVILYWLQRRRCR